MGLFIISECFCFYWVLGVIQSVVLPAWPLYVGVRPPYLDLNVWFRMRSVCVGVFLCRALLCARRINLGMVKVWSWLWNFVASLRGVSSWPCVLASWRHSDYSGVGYWICFGCFYVVVSVVVSIERTGSPRRSAFSGHISSGAAEQQNLMFPKEWVQNRFLFWNIILLLVRALYKKSTDSFFTASTLLEL